MKQYFSLSPLAFFLIVVFVAMVSGNDKAVFLVLFPILYSLVVSFGYLCKVIKDRKFLVHFLFSFSPIMLTGIIIFLARMGVVKGI